ncbi:MAG: type IV secretion system protein [Acidobacteriota bacterium]|nr:type IV secretion system protein [Acidobacteriota bacterium]
MPTELQDRPRYAERYGSAIMMAQRQWGAIVVLGLVCAGLLTLNFRSQAAAQTARVVIVRVNDQGRPDAAAFTSADYNPQVPEIKYFLSRFVHNFYSRIRATTRELHTESLWFLDPAMADAEIAKNKNTKDLETFLSGEGEEIEVAVRNVSIQELRRAPYKATVDYERIYLNPDHSESARKHFVASFVFVVNPNRNAPADINPLGFTITYFRTDEDL